MEKSIALQGRGRTDERRMDMPGIERWFNYVPKEERKRQQKEYFDRMYPLGEEQKRLEEGLLAQCVHAKMSAKDKMYQLLLVKEIIKQENEERRNRALKEWSDAYLMEKVPKEEQEKLYAIAVLTENITSLEEMPTAEAILRKAAECTLSGIGRK